MLTMTWLIWIGRALRPCQMAMIPMITAEGMQMEEGMMMGGSRITGVITAPLWAPTIMTAEGRLWAPIMTAEGRLWAPIITMEARLQTRTMTIVGAFPMTVRHLWDRLQWAPITTIEVRAAPTTTAEARRRGALLASLMIVEGHRREDRMTMMADLEACREGALIGTIGTIY